MPYLNKRQQEFRNQMKELEKVKNYKDIIDDHNSFYHNTAYDNEQEMKKEKRKRNNKIIIYIFIISFIMTGISLNFEKLKSKYEEINFQNSAQINTTGYKNYQYTQEEIKQNKVGVYHKNYTKRIENLNMIMNGIIDINNFQNSDIIKIQDQEKLIDELLIEFENYIPEDINIKLHDLNLKQLDNYRHLYPSAELLAAGFNDNQLIENYNTAISDINNSGIEFRNEIVKIFDEINISYTFLENGTINFTYPLIN